MSSSSLADHMEKMSRYRLTDKRVRITNVSPSTAEILGVVAYENDKGVFVEDSISNSSVFVPWTSIAVLKIAR